MKKTNFAEIMQQNGFQYTGKTSYDGQFIFGREWRKTSNVLWYGEMAFARFLSPISLG